MATYKPLLPTAADKERGLTQGLLQLGQSLSASGGYSKMPTSFLSALGQGGAAFGQGYQSEIERAKKGQLQNLQYQQAQAQMQQTQMNIDAAKKQQAQEAQAQLVADRYVNSKTMGGGAAGGQMGPTVGAGAALSAMDPLQRARMQSDSVGALQADIAAKVASDAATLDFKRKMQLAGAKPGVPKTVRTADGVYIIKPNGQLGNKLGDLPPPQSQIVTGGSLQDKRVMTLLDTNDKIGQRIQQLNTMESLAEQTPTGFGAEFKNFAAKAGAALGMNVDVEAINNFEQFKVQQMNFVMDRISGTKGSISEKEMDAFKAAGPNVGNTKRGNILIAKIMKAQEMREFELNEIETEELVRTGSVTDARNARSAARKILMSRPVLADEDLAFLGTQVSPTTTTQPATSTITQGEQDSLMQKYGPGTQ
jgi:hypothetical protein